MFFAVPIGLGVAIFLTELCPPSAAPPDWHRHRAAGRVPTIIYGIWGLFVFAPFLQEHVQPALIGAFGDVPVLSTLFAGPPYGIGVLTASLILAIMVLPFISAVFPRRVRDRAGASEGVRLRFRLHDMGGHPRHCHPLYAASALSAASCSALAAPSARPWP